MKTSKVAQDTARVMSALSNRRSSSRIATANSIKQSPRSKLKHIKIEIENTPVQLTTEDIDGKTLQYHISAHNSNEDSGMTSAVSLGNTSSKKRKRAESLALDVDDSKTKRRSPRKVIGVIKTEDIAGNSEDTNNSLFPRPARRLPSKRVKTEDGSYTVTPPANWERMYSMTVGMRRRRIAAVDTMGCENLADDTRAPRERRLQTLIALMLSSQTKDPVTAAAIKNMQTGLPRAFTLEDLLEVEPARLNELICKVGFHNNKTKYIKQTAEILRDRFGGDIPDTIEGLVSLPGVGPKMAYLTMSAAWSRDEGIGVDVHVHRITNLWGWHKTRNPEETRMELESWLPREKWHEINHLLVGFGQTYCPPVGRRCEGCDLAKEGLCPSAVVPKELKRKVKKEVKIEDDGGAEDKSTAHIKTEDMLVKATDDAPSLDLRADGQVKGDVDIKCEEAVEP